MEDWNLSRKILKEADLIDLLFLLHILVPGYTPGAEMTASSKQQTFYLLIQPH